MSSPPFAAKPEPVALLAEGVDRNHTGRGAYDNAVAVALLTEGVDRNTDIDWLGVGKNVSPSSRTAEDAARRGEHIGHLIFLHDSGQIPAVAVITQQADPAELCCKVHLLR